MTFQRICNHCKKIITEDIEPGTASVRTMDFWLYDYRGKMCESSHISNCDLCPDCTLDFLKWCNIERTVRK